MDDQPDLGRESRAEQPEGASPSKETRAQSRARRLSELKAKADRDGTVLQDFPTRAPAFSMTVLEALNDGTIERPDLDEAVQEGPLTMLAHEINARLQISDRDEKHAFDMRLAAAIQAAQARKLCDEKKMNFRKWVESHLNKNYETVRKLVIVGQSDDPAKALEDYRARTREHQRTLRERQKMVKFGPWQPTSSESRSLAAPLDASTDESQGDSPAPATQEPPVLAMPSEAASRDPDAMALFVLRRINDVSDSNTLHQLADEAAGRLAREEQIEHVQTLAKVTGLGISKGKGFSPTLKSVSHDFSTLSDDEQMVFIKNMQSLIERQEHDKDQEADQHGDG